MDHLVEGKGAATREVQHRTGQSLTAYLSNGGTLEHAQRIAGHASPKTTKLYDRTADSNCTSWTAGKLLAAHA